MPPKQRASHGPATSHAPTLAAHVTGGAWADGWHECASTPATRDGHCSHETIAPRLQRRFTQSRACARENDAGGGLGRRLPHGLAASCSGRGSLAVASWSRAWTWTSLSGDDLGRRPLAFALWHWPRRLATASTTALWPWPWLSAHGSLGRGSLAAAVAVEAWISGGGVGCRPQASAWTAWTAAWTRLASPPPRTNVSAAHALAPPAPEHECREAPAAVPAVHASSRARLEPWPGEGSGTPGALVATRLASRRPEGTSPRVQFQWGAGLRAMAPQRGARGVDDAQRPWAASLFLPSET